MTGFVLDAAQIAIEYMTTAQNARLAGDPTAATVATTVGAGRPYLN
jgi:hypothetical protein